MEDEKQKLLELGAALGQQHAFGVMAGRCSAAQAETLRRVREEKLYLNCAPTWAQFCSDFVGMSSSHADKIIRRLEEFGPKYFAIAQLTRISPDVYRAIEPAVKDGVLEHNGQAIELTPENSRKVTAAVVELRKGLAARRPAPAVPPPAPVSLHELDRRFDELLAQIRDAAVEGVPDRKTVSQTLHMMMYRLGNIVQEHRA